MQKNHKLPTHLDATGIAGLLNVEPAIINDLIQQGRHPIPVQSKTASQPRWATTSVPAWLPAIDRLRVATNCGDPLQR